LKISRSDDAPSSYMYGRVALVATAHAWRMRALDRWAHFHEMRKICCDRCPQVAYADAMNRVPPVVATIPVRGDKSTIYQLPSTNYPKT